MVELGLLRKGAYSPAYASSTLERDEVETIVRDLTGIDALIKILRRKTFVQENKIDNKIFCISAKTGAGKSTLMVYRLYKEFISKRHSRATLICTQPRVLLAQNKARELPEFFDDLAFGQNIGYSTSPNTVRPTSDRNIIFVTTQILNIMISKGDPMTFGKRHPIIIIDEAHETSVEMLTTLRTLKFYIDKYYREIWCPIVVIASATINPPRFIKYLGGDPLSPYNSALVGGATNYPIEEEYWKKDEIDSTTDAITLSAMYAIKEIDRLVAKYIDHKESTGRFDDILIIHKGPKELEQTPKIIFDMLSEKYHVYTAKEIYHMNSPPEKVKKVPIWFTIVKLSRLEVNERTEDYLITLKGRLDGERRIYISTPVSESGLTFSTLGVVIDSGRRYQPIPFPLEEIMSVLPLPIHALSRIQRMGRTGRKAPGKYIGLYTEDAKNAFMPDDYPSTITLPDASIHLLRLITTDHLSYFLEYNDSVPGVCKLLALHNAKRIFPEFDLLNDTQLLYNFSMDLVLTAFRTLHKNQLITRQGQLTKSGYQLALIGSNNIADAVFKALLMKELIHPFDITLLSHIVSGCFMNYTFGDKLRCSDAMELYFVEPKHINNPILTVFERCQELVELLATDGNIKEWATNKGIKLSHIFPIVIDALNEQHISNIKPYIEADEIRKRRIMRICMNAISVFEGAESTVPNIKQDPRDHFLSAMRT